MGGKGQTPRRRLRFKAAEPRRLTYGRASRRSTAAAAAGATGGPCAGPQAPAGDRRSLRKRGSRGAARGIESRRSRAPAPRRCGRRGWSRFQTKHQSAATDGKQLLEIGRGEHVGHGQAGVQPFAIDLGRSSGWQGALIFCRDGSRGLPHGNAPSHANKRCATVPEPHPRSLPASSRRRCGNSGAGLSGGIMASVRTAAVEQAASAATPVRLRLPLFRLNGVRALSSSRPRRTNPPG
jgi:hypothetical protein